LFNWDGGRLVLDGEAEQVFEVAGTDRGPGAASAVQNFAIRRIVVASGSSVRFVDDFDNDQQGVGPCTEAQYVDLLVLGQGASVVLQNCRVYYRQLVNEGALVTTTGDSCSGLVRLAGDCDLDGDTDLDDFVTFSGCVTGPGGDPPGATCACADLNFDNVVDLRDWAVLQTIFAGSP
jgi:hypothetical protein